MRNRGIKGVFLLVAFVFQLGLTAVCRAHEIHFFPQDYPVGDTPSALVLGDFDNDGSLDIATANWRDESTSVLLGNGDTILEED